MPHLPLKGCATTVKLSRGSLSVTPDPREGWFFASYTGTALAGERSESEESIRMRRWDAVRLITADALLSGLGMPKLTAHELQILRLIIVRGRLAGEYWTWVGMRGQTYIHIAIGDELMIERCNVGNAVRKLRKHDLVGIGKAYGSKPAIYLDEGFHRFCFEAQWREMLHHTNLRLMARLIATKGWKWLLTKVDEGFGNTKLNPLHKETRQRVLYNVNAALAM